MPKSCNLNWYESSRFLFSMHYLGDTRMAFFQLVRFFNIRSTKEFGVLEGVYTVVDDMLVIGNGVTMTEATAGDNAKLKTLFNDCRERKIKISKEKIEFKKTEMSYLGHKLGPRSSFRHSNIVL